MRAGGCVRTPQVTEACCRAGGTQLLCLHSQAAAVWAVDGALPRARHELPAARGVSPPHTSSHPPACASMPVPWPWSPEAASVSLMPTTLRHTTAPRRTARHCLACVTAALHVPRVHRKRGPLLLVLALLQQVLRIPVV
jgi:hypothetical protein